MTSRERLIKVLAGEIPDHVPVAPDTSNMIPAKLTGKPFWDIYLYQEIPIWKAYIDSVKYFGFDSLMDGYVSILFDDLGEINREWEEDWIEAIVEKTDERIVTQKYREANKKKEWANVVSVYYRGNPPNVHISPKKARVPDIPDKYEILTGKRKWPKGEELLKLVKQELGDHGLVGVWCGKSLIVPASEDGIFDYFDNPEKYYNKRDNLLEHYEKRFKKLMSLETKPDFICTGDSGTLVYQNVQTFRELGLPIVKKVTALCKEYGIPSHIHSCGREKELVRICAEETDLTVIDPLEVPPMGDCNLRELKEKYGHKLVLKGNLHTTNIMLNGTTRDVVEASKRAIDEAAEGGRFILSTGDQCGRDTPEENIFAMIETAKTYGRY